MDTANIARAAVRLSRIGRAPHLQDRIDALIATTIDEAIRDGVDLDDRMVDARFGWNLRTISHYVTGYAQVLPPFDAARISSIAAQNTPPDDLVALDAAGWSATGHTADYVSPDASMRLTHSATGWTSYTLGQDRLAWRMIDNAMPSVRDAVAPALAMAA